MLPCCIFNQSCDAGATALFSNGTALAPSGSAMVASLAKCRRIPVMFAVESYKFSEKVQLDSIVCNELGSATEVCTHASEKSDEPTNTCVPQTQCIYRGNASSLVALNTPNNDESFSFSVINLRYDITPLCNISLIITESGLIPPTSIPVLLKEMSGDMVTYASYVTASSTVVAARE